MSLTANHTKIMGVLNITPDSFSDGGRAWGAWDNAAITCAHRLISDGADVIDVGAESTRPGASPISVAEELRRLEVLPEIVRVAHEKNVKVSVDTRKTAVAEYAISSGVDYLNDVSGFTSDDMIMVAQNSNVQLIVMHNLGILDGQAEMIPNDADPVNEALDFFQRRVDVLLRAGINTSRLIIDPGIGFSKNTAQSWELISNIEKLHKLNLKILVGHSRKSIFTKFTTRPPNERDIETLATSMFLLQKGVSYVRVHNVSIHCRAFKLFRDENVLD